MSTHVNTRDEKLVSRIMCLGNRIARRARTKLVHSKADHMLGSHQLQSAVWSSSGSTSAICERLTYNV